MYSECQRSRVRVFQRVRATRADAFVSGCVHGAHVLCFCYRVFATAKQAPPSTPMIYIKVVKAEGIRQHKGRDATPSMLIRVSVAGEAQPQVLKTKHMPAGCDPTWLVLHVKACNDR